MLRMHCCRNFSGTTGQDSNSTLRPTPQTFPKDLEFIMCQTPQDQLSLSPPPLAVFSPSISSLLHCQSTRVRCTGPPDEPNVIPRVLPGGGQTPTIPRCHQTNQNVNQYLPEVRVVERNSLEYRGDPFGTLVTYKFQILEFCHVRKAK